MHRRYNLTLLTGTGVEVRIRGKLRPFVILDLVSENGLKDAIRQLNAQLADLSKKDPAYGNEPTTTYVLAVHDNATGSLIGHWTNT